MATSAKYLLIASTEAYCGKSATILGLSCLAREKEISIGYGQPIATGLKQGLETTESVADTKFLADTLKLAPERVKPPLLSLNRSAIDRRLQGIDEENYVRALQEYVAEIEGDLIFLEGPSNLWEGSIFNLSAPEIAEAVDASILLVARYHPQLFGRQFINSQEFFGRSPIRCSD